MKRFMQSFVVLAGLALVIGQADAGSDRRTGTAGAMELRIPVGTRGIALGGATVASNDGLQSLFYNPASLANTEGFEAYFANTTYLADTDVRYFALGSATDWAKLAITAKVLDLGQIEVTTEDAPEGTGQVEDITFVVVGLTGARYLTDAVSFGFGAHFINESILDVTATGVSFDVGLNYTVPWRGARFGLVMKNVGPNMSFDGSDLEHSVQLPGDTPGSRPRIVRTQSADFELPSYFQLGGEVSAYQNGDNRVTAFGTYHSNNFSNDELRGGVEYGYQDLLSLRGGYVYANQDDYLFGPSFGVGLNVPVGASHLVADYAYQAIDSFFDDLHTFSVRLRF